METNFKYLTAYLNFDEVRWLNSLGAKRACLGE
jgi:hypothetical protein